MIPTPLLGPLNAMRNPCVMTNRKICIGWKIRITLELHDAPLSIDRNGADLLHRMCHLTLLSGSSCYASPPRLSGTIWADVRPQ